MNFTISGYSTALFATWIFIEELGLLFDAGDGLSSSLLQKSRKVKKAFISHADRDHLGGIPQFIQLNAREGLPIIHYPKDSGSFPALKSFLEKFDPHVSGVQWIPIQENMEFKVKGKYFVKSIRNNHIVVAPEISKSLSYLLVEKKNKLKTEFLSLSGKEIGALVKEHGQEHISDQIEEKIIGYSGDTPVDDYERWDNTKILIHEATFLDDHEGLNTKMHKHSRLHEVMEMVSTINVEKLILTHFSTRYDEDQIDDRIKRLIKSYNIKIPVYRISPGKICHDILTQEPLI